MRIQPTYLKILGGVNKGRNLKSPKNDGKTRPMLARVKQTLFDIIYSHLEGAMVLDLCAGSGSIGLEAISRGALHVTFIEENPFNVSVIEFNLEKLGADSSTFTIYKAKLPGALRFTRPPFDLIFFDPPFQSRFHDETLTEIVRHRMLKKGGCLIFQRDRKSENFSVPKGLLLNRKHDVGDSTLWFLTNQSDLST